MAKKVPKMSDTDVQYALKELEAWANGQRGSRLTWYLLEKATGFSRQTLYAREGIAKAFSTAKKALATGKPLRRVRPDTYLEDRINELESQLKRWQELENQWLERWVRIAHHARAKGHSIEDLDKPLPPMKRK